MLSLALHSASYTSFVTTHTLSSLVLAVSLQPRPLALSVNLEWSPWKPTTTSIHVNSVSCWKAHP